MPSICPLYFIFSFYLIYLCCKNKVAMLVTYSLQIVEQIVFCIPLPLSQLCVEFPYQVEIN